MWATTHPPHQYTTNLQVFPLVRREAQCVPLVAGVGVSVVVVVIVVQKLGSIPVPVRVHPQRLVEGAEVGVSR